MLQNSTFLEVFRIFWKNNVISVKAAKVVLLLVVVVVVVVGHI